MRWKALLVATLVASPALASVQIGAFKIATAGKPETIINNSYNPQVKYEVTVCSRDGEVDVRNAPVNSPTNLPAFHLSPGQCMSYPFTIASGWAISVSSDTGKSGSYSFEAIN